ncbi:MAG: flavodoxin family protein [Chitinivibrionales bacterium]|nr:flavodoxin family protein [Chitinivibrionales bacterium]
MRIVGIVGSMRTACHTYTLVNRVINEVKALLPSAESAIITIADKVIHPCRVVCSSFCSDKPHQCSIADDVAAILQEMAGADILIIGTPLYFRAPPAQFQSWVERMVSIFYFLETAGGCNQASPVQGKPCGLVAVAQYSNPHQMLEYLHDFCTVLKMRPIGIDRFPYLGVAGQGDVSKDVVFNPFERSKELAAAIMRKMKIA